MKDGKVKCFLQNTLYYGEHKEEGGFQLCVKLFESFFPTMLDMP